MTLHVSPLVSTLRWYGSGDGYDARQPYDATGTVLWLTDDAVYLLALHGRMQMDYWRGLLEWLTAHGVRTVYAERRGKLKTLDVAALAGRGAARWPAVV